MANGNSNMPHHDTESQRIARATDKEIKEIKKLIHDLSVDSEVNKSSLSHICNSFEQLVKDNSTTHYKLFARTEAIRLDLSKLETSHNEHIKHDACETASKNHRTSLIASWCAVGVSIVTVIITMVVILLKKTPS